MFKIFKPRSCLQSGDKYKTKPELAGEILQELKALGFPIKLVLADSLYGESGDVIGVLTKLKLQFIVAILRNHPVWLLPGERVRYNRWRAYQQELSHRQAKQRFIREIIFGKRRTIRYYQITKGSTPDPEPQDTWFIMTNLPGKIQLIVAQLYSLRTWIDTKLRSNVVDLQELRAVEKPIFSSQAVNGARQNVPSRRRVNEPSERAPAHT